MKELDKEAMSSAIKEMISFGGIEILEDEDRFQAFIKDVLNNSIHITEQHMLIMFVKTGMGRELVRAFEKSPEEQDRTLILVSNRLEYEYGFGRTWCDHVLDAVTCALGWNRDSLAESGSMTFGAYKWKVLCKEKGMVLLLTEELTDIGIPYNREIGETSWAGCSLRRWLNSDFLARFNREQQERILSRRVRAESNQWYHTAPGNPTEDKVFLLSISEVIQYLGDSGSLGLRPENRWIDSFDPEGKSCAIDDGFNTARCATYKNESTWWWLRSPGKSESRASYVNAEGIIFLNGETAFDDGGTSCVGVRPGIRPAIWLRKG